MSTFEYMPSWVGQEVATLVQHNSSVMRQIEALSRRRVMRAFAPIARDLEPECVQLPLPPVSQTSSELDWAA